MNLQYNQHNRFREGLKSFLTQDPQLVALLTLKYQYQVHWWQTLPLETPGIYILTGGRQVGKSTSCKLLIKYCLENQIFSAQHIFYLPCDEIFDAKTLSDTLRLFLQDASLHRFLLIIDEITFVKGWERVIKALADEGWFTKGLCVLTGSDTLILKEAATSFPGRRGKAECPDFHLFPLSFGEYVQLRHPFPSVEDLKSLFQDYLSCGGYLRAINDLAETGEIQQATYLTYEQWIRGDLLKQGKKESTLLALIQALLTIGVSPTSYSSLTRKIGLISKDTCIDYCNILERMDVLMSLQAFDQNKKQGFPKKDKKFHFTDPFIVNTLYRWLHREGLLNKPFTESFLVEACVASHCHRTGKVFYFKGQGEVDVIQLTNKKIQAIEVKWAEQIRTSDLKTLKTFPNALILTKAPFQGQIDAIQSMPVYQFLVL